MHRNFPAATAEEPKPVAWEPVSAGTRHSARLLYYAYQTVVGTLKIYVAVDYLQLGLRGLVAGLQLSRVESRWYRMYVLALKTVKQQPCISA